MADRERVGRRMVTLAGADAGCDLEVFVPGSKAPDLGAKLFRIHPHHYRVVRTSPYALTRGHGRASGACETAAGELITRVQLLTTPDGIPIARDRISSEKGQLLITRDGILIKSNGAAIRVDEKSLQS